MTQISFEQMEFQHDGTEQTGEPYHYCRHGSRVRLFPTPGQAYTLTWSGIFEGAPLSSDAISNGWMVHGELLIRSTAKLLLLRDYIKSYEDVPAAQAAVSEALRALDVEHTARTARRRMRANG